MDYIKIITLVILFISSLFLLYWVYRPGSKEKYDEYGQIPLKSDAKIMDDGNCDQESLKHD